MKLKILSKRLISNRQMFLELCFLVGLGFLPIIWTQGKLLAGFDIPIFPNMREYLLHAFFLWDDRLYLGNPSADVALIFPVQVPWALFEALGISMATRTTIMLCALFAATGVGMYYFVSVLDPRRQRLSRLVAAAFYMFNLFSLQIYSWQQYSLIMAYILLPVCLGLCKTAYEQYRIRNLAIIAVLSLFITPQYLPAFILFWGTITVYAGYVLLLRPGSRLFVVKLFATSGLLSMAVTAPFLIAFSSLTVAPITAWAERSKALVDFYMSQASTLNIVRLMGFYTWGQDNVVPHYSFGESYYHSPILIFLTFLVPLGAFGAMLLDKRLPRDIVFFLGLLPCSLLLTTGRNGPFGPSFYEWLHHNIPGFTSIFGHATTKVPMLTTLSYAVLLAYLAFQAARRLVEGISKREQHRNPAHFKIIHAAAVIICIGIAWPMATGDLIPATQDNPELLQFPSMRVEVPNDWLQSIPYANNLIGENERLLLLPRSPSFQNRYPWYMGIDPPQTMYHSALVTADPGAGKASGLKNIYGPYFTDLLYRSFQDADIATFEKMLNLTQVRGILHRRDLDPTWFGLIELPRNSPEEVNGFLRSLPFVSRGRTFGTLDFYRNNTLSLPMIWSSTELVLSDRFDGLGLAAIRELELPRQAWLYRDTFQQMPEDMKAKLDGRVVKSIVPQLSDLMLLSTGAKAWSVENELSDHTTALAVSSQDGQPCLAWSFNTGEPQFKYSIVRNVVEDLSQYEVFSFRVFGNAPQLEIDFVLDENGSGAGDGKYAQFFTTLTPNRWQDVTFGKMQLRYVNTSPFSVEDWKNIKRLRFMECAGPACGTISNGAIYSLCIQDASMVPFLTTLRNDQASNNPPKVAFLRINPTRYLVRIEKAAQPFLLILGQSFHPWWRATINNQTVDKDRHFLINGYANGWWIDERGDYEVVLEYWPQKWLYIGLAISSIALLLCIGCLVLRVGFNMKHWQRSRNRLLQGRSIE